jgi:outer membrane protein TolC
LPPLQKRLAVQRDLLMALIGRLLSQEPAEKVELASLQLPQDLPLSLPSQLVDQRPDVRSAEAQLHAASAQIGVAIAAMLPQFTLTANAAARYADTAALFRGLGGGWWNRQDVPWAKAFDIQFVP